MSATFSFWTETTKACSAAISLYFQPLQRLLQHPSEYLSEPKKPLMRVDALFGEDMRFVGDVDCEWKCIRIDGHWVGNVTCNKGTVAISQTGSLEGNIFTAFAVIDGNVKGHIVASCAVEIQTNAQIEGDVHAPVVEVIPGAMVRGKIETSEAPGSAMFHKFRGTVREIADEVTKIHRVK